jgi:hypothetical protein
MPDNITPDDVYVTPIETLGLNLRPDFIAWRMTEEPGFVQFRVTDLHRFQVFVDAFEILKQGKLRLDRYVFGDNDDPFFEQETEPDNDCHERMLRHLAEQLSHLFDEHHFRWPSSHQERQADGQRLEALSVHYPVPPHPPNPPWDLEEMISGMLDREWELSACRLLTLGTAIVEFWPHSYPFGGTACLHALIEAFDFPLLGENDGEGPVSFL